MKKYLFLVTLFFLFLTNCTREDDIRVNGTLRNNHSVLFAFTERPDSLAAFVDSIAALDSVYTYDTLTVTVHDSVYFVGFLKYNSKKVVRYAWKMGDKDTLFNGKNEELFVYRYDSAATYSPLFIAVDGANARDTAGRGQYIRVINTPPDISVEADTLWTRGEKDAQVSFFASDSFGRIDSAFVIPLNSKKKAIDTLKAKPGEIDSLYTATVKYKAVKEYLNSQNELLYIYGAIDEDGNVSKDTAVLHFNKIPTVSLLQPDSASRQNIFVSRFAFYYSGSDEDNPADLRYTIRVGKSPDNAGTAPVLTDANLVATNIREKSWEAITDSVWNMDETLRGRLYWQVSVTDGYDTATSPTWNFFFGDLSATTGTIHGYAKFQGRTAHNGIQVVMENRETGNYTFTHTSEKGYFSANVDPGIYRIYARDTTGFGYKYLILDSQYVEMGDERLVATMLLEDSIAPKIRIDKYDSIVTSRSVTFAGSLSDSGAQIASAKAWLDGSETSLSVLKVNEWNMTFKDLTDGNHQFKFVVLDSAKNVSDTAKIAFKVKASSLNLTVNGKATSMVTSDESFEFIAEAKNVRPIPDSIYWTTSIGGKTYKIKASAVGKDSTAKTTLTAADFASNGAVAGTLYTMIASTANGTISDSVRFGIRSDNPIIYFLTPGRDTSVTLNDPLSFSIEHFLGATATSGTITWTCPNTLSDGYSCPADNAESGNLAWKTLGTKKIYVNLKDSDGKTSKDSIVVQIISDVPTVSIKASADTIRQKINASLSYSVTASDKYGTVNAVEWGCGTDASKISFGSSASISAAKSVSATFSVTLPSSETNAYKCIVRATDDDGEYGYDTLYFRAVKDAPSITLYTTSAEVKINAKVRLAGAAVDTLGKIESYAMYCGKSLSNPSWTSISKADTTITMPGSACTWYCMMRVTDDDDLTATDTAVYTVLLDLPTVMASEDTMTVSIKDTLGLDAIANDKLGQIVLYQWSCGNKGVAGNSFVSSTSTPRYSAIMPTVATDNYLCIIRVTDDDGNTAQDTTKITVLLDAPTIKVSTESITTRINYPIEINATASDKMGYITKREWSCGNPSEISSNWKTVSDYDTTWTGPSTPYATYYCVARATDDDGNQVQDTTVIHFTTDIPVITVDQDLVYIIAGTNTDLTAHVNSAWQGVKRYTWTCGTKGSSDLSDTTSAKDHHVWWGFNNSTDYKTSDYYFWDDNDANGTKDSVIAKLSKAHSEFLCIVWAQESGSNFVATDTTTIRTMTSLPVGVISMPDTVYLWSTDSSVLSNKSIYWYTPDANGSSSKLGTLGDEDAQQFWWNFSNVSDKYWYQGKSDGSLDTSIAEFNAAFIRQSMEGSITIKLDYFDSSKALMDQNFTARHEAEVVSKKVHFKKAWHNISGGTNDTIVETSTNANGPAIAYCNDRLILAYVNESGALVTKYRNSSKWTSFGSPSISGISEQTLYMACDGNNNLYLSYISTSDGMGHVYKSTSSTGTWTELGSGIGNALTALKLKINPKTNNPSVAWIGTVNSASNFARVQDYSGSAWGSAFSPIYSRDWQNREIDMAFDESGNRLVIASGYGSGDYKIYYYYIPNGQTSTSNNNNNRISINGESIQIFYADGYFYVGFRSRDDDGLPRLARAKASSSLATTYEGFTTTGAEFLAFGHRSYNAYFTVDKNNNPILAIDDAYYARNSHVHVYRFMDGAWGELGENELPYFKNVYAKEHGYYVRGFRPQLTVSPSGQIYISMRSQEAASSAASSLPGTKNGPIVMEYLGDNW